MGFLSSLKKVLPYVERGAVIAQQAEGNPIGAALAAVKLIVSRGEPVKESPGVVQVPQGQLLDAIKALAVAVDDHEKRMVALEKKKK